MANEQSISPKQTYAGLWLHSPGDLGQLRGRVRKVAAHQELEQDALQGCRELSLHELSAVGNFRADELAKGAARLVEASPGLVAEHKFVSKSVTGIFQQVATRLACWPFVSELHARKFEQQQQHVHELRLSHELLSCSSVDGFVGGPLGSKGVFCVRCFAVAATPKREAKLRQGQCSPMHSKVMLQLRKAAMHDHRLVRFDTEYGRPLFACSKCGRYASAQFRSLLEPCRRQARNWRWHKLFVENLHPTVRTKLVCVGPVAFPLSFDGSLFDVHALFKDRREVANSLLPKQPRSVLHVHDFDEPEGSLISESD